MSQPTLIEAFDKIMSDEVFAAFYYSLPESIRELIRKYPYPTYKVKQGAPYGISCPGSIVHLQAYGEDGMLRVILFAKDKLPAAIEHEKRLCAIHHKDPAEIHASNTAVHIDPKWLEPYFE